MVNVLLMRYDFDFDWAYESLKPYLSPGMRAVILTMTHGDEIPDGETWLSLYGAGGMIREIFVRAFGRYGIPEDQITFVSWFHDDTSSARKKLSEADVVFMTGGLPDVFYDRMQHMAILEDVRHFSGIVMGCSCGAMIQMEEYHITPDDDYDTYGYYPGLGMLNAFEPEVHYCGSDIQKQCMRRYMQERGKVIYAISNDGGLLVDNGRITCLGDVQVFSSIADIDNN